MTLTPLHAPKCGDACTPWSTPRGSRLRSSHSAPGTSASRMSTYLSGKVVPSAALMVRCEIVARKAQPDRE